MKLEVGDYVYFSKYIKIKILNGYLHR